jgi:hypothetical protein
MKGECEKKTLHVATHILMCSDQAHEADEGAYATTDYCGTTR